MEKKTCHGCGLEDADEPNNPTLDALEPCSKCLRNPRFKDHWNECWTIGADGKPFIER